MKAWLKGGLIGVVVSALIFLADFIFLCKNGFLDSCGFYVMYAGFPVSVIGQGFDSYFLVVVLFLVEYFILGALIGLIISKIKNKN
jgi:hypothetical protein